MHNMFNNMSIDFPEYRVTPRRAQRPKNSLVLFAAY
jgi:hypothetical protein